MFDAVGLFAKGYLLKPISAEDIIRTLDEMVHDWRKAATTLAIDVNKIKCDAYDFEKWDAIAINSFKGEYMVNYSWAELTTGRYVSMEREYKK